jgi:glucokinase
MPTRRTIGVDIGETSLLAGAVDADLDVHHRTQRAITGLDQSSLLDAALDAVEEARAAAGAEIAAVGFAIPSLAHQRSETSVEATFAGVAAADVMAERLGLPAFADGRANLAARAEHRAGAARGTQDAIVLTLGNGIDGGLILDGEPRRLERGAFNASLPGPPFELGDSLAQSAAAHPDSQLARALSEGREPAAQLVTELAHDGDRAAIESLTSLGRQLGAVIAALVNAYNPQVVVVGGGVIGAGELLLGPARAELAQRDSQAAGDQVPIVPARFGVDAGLVGAAALAFDGLERRGREAA